MKVLFITHVPNMAGANRSMLQLISELKTNYGVDIVVLGPQCQSDKEIEFKLKQIGIEYIEAPVKFFKVEKPTLHLFARHIRQLYNSRNFYKRLQSYNFDIIHSNSSVIDCGGYLSRQLHCKHVWHFREFGDSDYNFYPVGGRLYEYLTYKNSDAIIAISKIIAGHFKNKVAGNKIHVIYNQ